MATNSDVRFLLAERLGGFKLWLPAGERHRCPSVRRYQSHSLKGTRQGGAATKNLLEAMGNKNERAYMACKGSAPSTKLQYGLPSAPRYAK